MESIKERRRKALFNWASNQRPQYLASLLVNVISNKTIKDLCEDEGIKV